MARKARRQNKLKQLTCKHCGCTFNGYSANKLYCDNCKPVVKSLTMRKLRKEGRINDFKALGTGTLKQDRLKDFNAEAKAVQAELRRIMGGKVNTKNTDLSKDSFYADRVNAENTCSAYTDEQAGYTQYANAYMDDW
jgi:hypothetical protein